MNLNEIIQREPCPAPWAEEEKIPWNEAEFSQRMLREHLSQEHDMASRREALIDQHLAWIHGEILQGKPARILDLGCGPGFYCNRLAALGHTCTGIDFSPASIGYAQENRYPNARFFQADLRTAEFSSGFDLAMLIYGELNVFTPQDARLILHKAHSALVAGGILLLEVHTFECVQRLGQAPATWYSAEQGVFADGPYLCLMENFWHAGRKVAVERFYVLEVESSAVRRYGQSIQGYENEEYQKMIGDLGYTDIQTLPALTGTREQADGNLFVLLAMK